MDEGETGEIDSVERSDFWKVVDQCYLCDVCYLTKCPYVPPHEWNVDFPHTMLRAKAIQFKKGTKTKYRDKILSNTSTNGKLASIPVVVKATNLMINNKLSRKLGDSLFGVHKDAWLPTFAEKTFDKASLKSQKFPVINGKKSLGKVAIYSTCFVNWNEPNIGHSLIKILVQNEISFVVVDKQTCCGMPKLELGDLESVAELKKKNIPQLAKLASEGFAILSPIPSCTLMFKQELPLMFPDDEDVKLVQRSMFDPFEYLQLRRKDSLLNTEFKRSLGNVSYHMSCHLRVQNVGQKTREILEMVPNSSVNTVERCSGHAGTWGVKKEFHKTAMKIGKPVFRKMKNHPKSNDTSFITIASDCQLASHHIDQGIVNEFPDTETFVKHPLELLAKAYGH
ncbi:MAG: Fe-S oxidoreductase [Betaproteobacteria bacterium TMED156]|nr:MAG: Fe-S oxidoreductase [Betaproteobacteria bacterium TMED156]